METLLKAPQPTNDFVLKLPPELVNLGAKAEAWMTQLSQVVWWDGFSRGVIIGAIIATITCVAITLLTKRASHG